MPPHQTGAPCAAATSWTRLASRSPPTRPCLMLMMRQAPSSNAAAAARPPEEPTARAVLAAARERAKRAVPSPQPGAQDRVDRVRVGQRGPPHAGEHPLRVGGLPLPRLEQRRSQEAADHEPRALV